MVPRRGPRYVLFPSRYTTRGIERKARGNHHFGQPNRCQGPTGNPPIQSEWDRDDLCLLSRRRACFNLGTVGRGDCSTASGLSKAGAWVSYIGVPGSVVSLLQHMGLFGLSRGDWRIHVKEPLVLIKPLQSRMHPRSREVLQQPWRVSHPLPSSNKKYRYGSPYRLSFITWKPLSIFPSTSAPAGTPVINRRAP
jgi:hypothetical protein